MSGLCFAMDRHHEQLTQRREPSGLHRLLLRWVGVAMLVGAIDPCVMAWGRSVGPVAWLGFLSAAALSVALLLPCCPRVVAWLGAGAGIGGLATLMAHLPR